jgi:hypothetical protein
MKKILASFPNGSGSCHCPLQDHGDWLCSGPKLMLTPAIKVAFETHPIFCSEGRLAERVGGLLTVYSL